MNPLANSMRRGRLLESRNTVTMCLRRVHACDALQNLCVAVVPCLLAPHSGISALGLQRQATTVAQVTCRNLSAPDCTRLRAERLAPLKNLPTADGTAAVVLMTNARLLLAEAEIN